MIDKKNPKDETQMDLLKRIGSTFGQTSQGAKRSANETSTASVKQALESAKKLNSSKAPVTTVKAPAAPGRRGAPLPSEVRDPVAPCMNHPNTYKPSKKFLQFINSDLVQKTIKKK